MIKSLISNGFADGEATFVIGIYRNNKVSFVLSVKGIFEVCLEQ